MDCRLLAALSIFLPCLFVVFAYKHEHIQPVFVIIELLWNDLPAMLAALS